ncbi:MAG: hypothetical protein WC612_01305 [Bdellovibrionales bacterium]|jgi:hypothetical protein
MVDSTSSESAKDAGAHLQMMLAAFRQVGMPLLQALVDVSGSSGEVISAEDEGAKTKRMGDLVECAVLLSREMAKEIGADEGDLAPSVRWNLAGSASQVVAASYQATGQLMSAEDITRLVRIASALQEKFKNQIPAGGETVPNTVATFRAKMMEGFVPVIGAVAQYAFGRAEHDLLAEVSERLVKTADQVTRTLAASGSSPEQWRLLCWTILRAAGQIYTESHYAEADRLNAMAPDVQAAYFAQHGSTVPMTQVWQAFNQRMAMLATLSTYLEVPPSAHLEEQGW